MFGMSRGDQALVVAPHPDDETLGCGGTLARLAEAGVDVHVLVVACPTLSAPDAGVRRSEFDAACDVLGVAGRRVAWAGEHRAQHPGAHMRDLVDLVETGPGPSLRTVRPVCLLLPAAGAHHQDHQATHLAAMAAARPGAAHPPRTVLGFEGPDDRAWGRPEAGAVLVDTSHVWALKEKALLCYPSQLRDDPHPRSVARVRALDAATGVAAGADTAERLAVYRMVF